MHAVISIHDVMPSTIDRVAAIIERLPEACADNLILLVVPGLDWQQEQIEQLGVWQRAGIRLAGHGWTHEVRHVRGWYHRLHSLVLSRRAAEHLSLTTAEIESLMRKNFEWFTAHGLQSPNYYVPPAWALGAIDGDRLARLPWEYLETTSRLVNLRSREQRWLPLVGFEADTALRKFLLTIINNFNEWIASASRPLRISIHPFDFDYLMADELESMLQRVEKAVPVEVVFASD